MHLIWQLIDTNNLLQYLGRRNNIQHNNTQHNDIHRNNKLNTTISIDGMSSVIYAKCPLCWLSQISLSCWVSLSWMSLRLVLLWCMSWHLQDIYFKEFCSVNFPLYKNLIFFNNKWTCIVPNFHFNIIFYGPI
jgi:hypothetical protein